MVEICQQLPQTSFFLIIQSQPQMEALSQCLHFLGPSQILPLSPSQLEGKGLPPSKQASSCLLAPPRPPQPPKLPRGSPPSGPFPGQPLPFSPFWMFRNGAASIFSFIFHALTWSSSCADSPMGSLPWPSLLLRPKGSS